MAQPMNLKPFYLGFAALAVVGAAAIWWARGGGTTPVEVDPVPVNASSFAGYVLGSDSAAVEIIEYADFGCGACAQFAVLAGADIKSRLVEAGRVRIRFRDFAIPSHPSSPDAHLAAACAGEQGQFFAMHDQLFFGQRDWTRQRRPDRQFRDYAEAIRLDMSRYDDCVRDRRHMGRIDAAKQEGLAVGVSSTPSFVIGGLLVVGALPYDSVVALVERAEGAATR
jgi:protein-disulfide isomerase